MANIETFSVALAGSDPVFLKFIKNSLQIIPSNRKVVTPLKNLYSAYKKQAILDGVLPMKYKTFRTLLGSAFASLSEDVIVYQKNKTWLIKNVVLEETTAILELYQKFYNLTDREKTSLCQS